MVGIIGDSLSVIDLLLAIVVLRNAALNKHCSKKSDKMIRILCEVIVRQITSYSVHYIYICSVWFPYSVIVNYCDCFITVLFQTTRHFKYHIRMCIIKTIYPFSLTNS